MQDIEYLINKTWKERALRGQDTVRQAIFDVLPQAVTHYGDGLAPVIAKGNSSYSV